MTYLYQFFGSVLICLVAKLFSFNVIVGSAYQYFSLSSVVLPVMGFNVALGWLVGMIFAGKIISTSSLFIFFIFRFPLLIGAKAFQNKSFLTSCLLPLACMLMFITHPVGAVAWVYSLYWLIPIALFFVKDSEWSRALSASFGMHAVGSVVWLYTTTMSSSVWLGLIPLVACERLLIATGIMFASRIYAFICNHYQNFVKLRCLQLRVK